MNKFNILIIFLIVTILSLIFYSQLHLNFDDSLYALYGEQILNGTFNIAQSPYAYGYLYPETLALSMKIFGINTFATDLPNYLEFLAIICIIYILNAKFYGEKTGLVVAIMGVFSGFILMYSTRVLPDMLLGLFFALVILFYEYSNDVLNLDLKFYYLETCGFLLGSTIFIKLGGFGFTIFFLLALFLTIKRKQKMFVVLFGYCMAIALYLISIHSIIGIYSLVNTYTQTQVSLNKATLLGNFYVLSSLFANYNLQTKTNFFAQVFPLGFLFICAIAGFYTGLFKDERLNFYSLFFWFFFLWMLFGTESIHNWTFVTVVSRYFIWEIAAVSILAGYFVKNHERIMYLILFIGATILTNFPIYYYFLMNRWA